MRTAAALDVRSRLSDPGLPARATDLGFGQPDLAALLAAADTVLARDEDLGAVTVFAERLVQRIGAIDAPGWDSVWSGVPSDSPAGGSGLLPMLALLVTAPEVTAFHASRGVEGEVSTATLADLGQQVRVHRLTYDEFGLHTQGWLTTAWSGALYWLGRLQFNLQREDGPTGLRDWVLSTHIPRTGPLTPASVDASFAAAREFFGRHFPDYPSRDFYCQSWLLDPALDRLVPDANLAAFQRRWQLYGPVEPGEDDVLFFLFNRRPPVVLDYLPTDTSLRRLVLDRLNAGLGWSVRRGRIPQ
jgi:hypothetical protein